MFFLYKILISAFNSYILVLIKFKLKQVLRKN